MDNTAAAPVNLELMIGGQDIPNLELQVGEFAYIFEKTHTYPIISVSFSELRVKTIDCDHLYVIYALINSGDIRRNIATSCDIIKLKSGGLIYCRGSFGYFENPDMSVI